MDDFSNEGLYRLLEKMDREHGEELREIRKQTTATNGRVTAIETKIDGHARELGRLNSAVFPRTAIVDTVPARRATDKGDAIAINVPMNAKTITALILTLAALAAAAFGGKVSWL